MTYPMPSPGLLARLSERLGPAGFTTDPADLAPWLTDWRRRLTGSAAALVSPANAEEAAFIVASAAAEGVAIVPQGGNSSMVAGATPAGIGEGRALLVSMRRMRAIRSVSAADNAVTAEAGVVLADLHAAVEAQGRRFPLSLASKGNATVGGLISTNAGGTQVLRFGPMRSLVLGLEAVLPDGSMLRGLAPLRKDNRGYDLKQLLIGGEGTLGLVTAATLKLVPAIGERAVAWVGFRDPEQALTLLRRLEDRLGEAVESFELVPAEGLALVLRHIPDTRAPLVEAWPWNVLVEAVAPAGDAPLGERLEGALAEALEAGLIGDAALAVSEAQADAFWKLRESMSEAEARDGMAAKHDISVTVADMPAFMARASAAVVERFPGARPIAFGHLGDGNVHFNVRAPSGGDDKAWFKATAAEVSRFVHGLVTEAGGSLSAEHGIGRFKCADFLHLIDPARLAAMMAVKHALDPAGIMNPGALLPLAEAASGP
ncbi:FAD-binding oxidoreductase [Sphingomonas sp. PR090111-T3T-6A]|uniref:FAD-binding oxidoreductase n=1 Tax=Sphingomonas sp. PR090111-T3T-6A TaxID=685778 RepID=UPI000366F069|nr:FAD-binding oxidoreductase [Sphingomonas sp. PR090111-T3T-6A]